MNKIFKYFIAILVLGLSLSGTTYAGNKQRIAQAGASQLLINPWAVSSGFSNANVSCVTGLDGVFINIAGTAHILKTEAVFSHTMLYKGSDISLNAFGFSQRVGDAGVLSLTFTGMNWGKINRTTVELPDGDGTYFEPSMSIIGVSYAKEFSNSIYGGATIKVISEGINNISASGVALDAGIQYITGERNEIKFGIAMKNVGPTMKYSGDGMTFRTEMGHGPVMTSAMRGESFELPTLVTLGFSYDIDIAAIHTITPMIAFTEHSFSVNEFQFGGQYSFKELFKLRAGYSYADGNSDVETRSSIYSGFAGGFSVDVPLSKEGTTKFAIDYSYRQTYAFDGTHSLGLRITL